MHVRDLATSVGVQWKCPDAAAPHSTPEKSEVMYQGILLLIVHRLLVVVLLCGCNSNRHAERAQLVADA